MRRGVRRILDSRFSRCWLCASRRVFGAKRRTPHSKFTKSHSRAGLKRVATGSAGFRLRHPALLRPVTTASEANPGCSKRHRAADAAKTAKVPLGCVPLCGNDLPPTLRPLEGFRLSTLNLVRPRHPLLFLAKHTHDLPCPPPLRRFLSTLLPPPFRRRHYCLCKRVAAPLLRLASAPTPAHALTFPLWHSLQHTLWQSEHTGVAL